MIVLREVFDTVYFTNDYCPRIEYLLSCIRNSNTCDKNIWAHKVKDAINTEIGNTPVVIDFAGARMTNKVVDMLRSMLMQYPGTISYIDSEDEHRDKFLREWTMESMLPKKNKIPLPPQPTNITDFIAWIQELDNSVIWDALCYVDTPEVATFVQLMRPELQFIMPYMKLFEYIKDVFKSVLLLECDEFLYIPGKIDEPISAYVNEQGMVHIVNIGDIPKQEFITKYPCIPAFIGKVAYTDSTGTPLMRDAVRHVINDVLRRLNERPTTIGSYFKEEMGVCI